MISEAEILHIINQVHPDDAVLVELKDGTVFGILKGAESAPTYFRTRAAVRSAAERRSLFESVALSRPAAHVDCITLETLMNGLRGMRIRHVWLERRAGARHEMAFLNFKELEHHLRRHEL